MKIQTNSVILCFCNNSMRGTEEWGLKSKLQNLKSIELEVGLLIFFAKATVLMKSLTFAFGLAECICVSFTSRMVSTDNAKLVAVKMI